MSSKPTAPRAVGRGDDNGVRDYPVAQRYQEISEDISIELLIADHASRLIVPEDDISEHVSHLTIDLAP